MTYYICGFHFLWFHWVFDSLDIFLRKMSISNFVKANFALYSCVAKHSDHDFYPVKLHINRWCFVLFLWGLRDVWILWYCFCRTFNIYHLLSSFILSLILQEMYPLPNIFLSAWNSIFPDYLIWSHSFLGPLVCFVDIALISHISWLLLVVDSQHETLSESGYMCILLLLGLHCPSSL